MRDGAYIFDNIHDMVVLIQSYGTGFNEALIDAYMIPKNIIYIEYDETTGNMKEEYKGQPDPYYIEKTISKPTTLNGYTPKNRKTSYFPLLLLS